MVDSFFKKRTHLGCLGASFDFCGANMSKIICKTGLWVLAFAATSGLLSMVNDVHMGKPIYGLTLLALGVCVLFMLDVKIKTNFLSLLTCNDEDTGLFKRTLLTCGLLTCIIALCCILFAVVNYLCFTNCLQISQPKTDNIFAVIIIVNILLVAIIFFFTLPFCYSCTKYILTGETRFKDIFGKDYVFGAKKVGFLMVLALIIVLMTIVAIVMLAFPSIIILSAQNIDLYGVASGDVSGLPSYFNVLHFVSSAMMSLVMQYLSLWILLMICYAYSNLESCNIKKTSINK